MDDAHVLPECREQPAQALDGEAVEPPPVQVREVRLRDAEAAGGGPLRQALRLDQLLNRVRQVGLRKQFVGVVEHVDHPRKIHGVDGAIRATVVILDEFQHACTAEASERLRHARHPAERRTAERSAEGPSAAAPASPSRRCGRAALWPMGSPGCARQLPKRRRPASTHAGCRVSTDLRDGRDHQRRPATASLAPPLAPWPLRSFGPDYELDGALVLRVSGDHHSVQREAAEPRARGLAEFNRVS